MGVDRPEWLLPAGAAPLPERAPRAFAAYLGIVRATTRFDLGGLEPARRELGGRSAIVATLHRESLLNLLCPYSARIAVLVADLDVDGMYPKLARRLGYETVAARPWSSLRRALEALARPGAILVVAVDGPAGPVGAVNPGLVKLARMSGAPLVPVRCSATRAITLARTWDNRLVPVPGGVLASVAGHPLELRRDAPPAEVARVVQRLRTGLADLEPAVRRGRSCSPGLPPSPGRPGPRGIGSCPSSTV